jgi:hypothetical protein
MNQDVDNTIISKVVLSSILVNKTINVLSKSMESLSPTCQRLKSQERHVARIDPQLSVDLISSFPREMQSACLNLLPLYFDTPNTQHGSSSNVTPVGPASMCPPSAHYPSHHVILHTLASILAAAAAKVIRLRDGNVTLLRPRLVMVGPRGSFSHPPRNESSPSRLHSVVAYLQSRQQDLSTHTL